MKESTTLVINLDNGPENHNGLPYTRKAWMGAR
jgi:hypothetical protein